MDSIIFEGPDCSGKSTLINNVKASLFNGDVVHHGPYHSVTTGTLMSYYVNSIQQDNCLIDRCWLSETIYGPQIRNHNRLLVAHQRMLQRVMLTNRTVTVLCLPPFEVVKEKFLGRRSIEYVEQLDDLKKIYESYESAMNRPNTLTLAYDYTGECRGAFSNVEYLMDCIEKYRGPINIGPGIGKWDPERSILIVGDKVNTNKDAGYGMPFVDFGSYGSSHWLAEKLEGLGIPENQLYWINATTNGFQTDSDFLDILKPRLVIALGNNAAGWCRDAGIEFEAVPHPSYWKRFYSNLEYPLREVINAYT